LRITEEDESQSLWHARVDSGGEEAGISRTAAGVALLSQSRPTDNNLSVVVVAGFIIFTLLLFWRLLLLSSKSTCIGVAAGRLLDSAYVSSTHDRAALTLDL
jgi:hypothetical protein